MRTIDKMDSGHSWHKKNLVTKVTSRGKYYDELKCKICGITGKSYTLTTVVVSAADFKKAATCPGLKIELPKKIKITHCYAVGKIFANLTDGSEHNVIAPPPGNVDDLKGVWIMGIGEPVKVLSREFIKVE